MPDARHGQAPSEQQNFVAGTWRPSSDAGRFVVRDGLAPERVLGSWPRSGASELEALQSAWARAPDAWAQAERRAVCARAARRIEQDDEGAVLCAAILGLEPQEWSRHRSGLAAAPLAQGPPGTPAGGVSVLAPHWSELLSGTWSAVVRELLAGRRVLLLADERLPACADVVVRALLEEGLPPGRLALLHGLAADQLGRALALPDVRALVASGSAERLLQLRRAAAPRADLELRLEALQGAARAIDAQEDLEQAAREIVERSCGRAATLSGQLGGQVARVHCPERRLSAFTGALLAALEASLDVARPLRFVSGEEAAAAQRLRSLGLDEGATLIFGPALRDAERPGRAHPVLFTNVEPFMDCARPQAPAPVLCLLRTPGAVRS